MIVYWKIPFVDKTKYEVAENRTVHKRGEKELYINTDALCKRDQLFVEIACEWQKRLSAPDLFFQIRDLFVEGDGWTKIPDVMAWVGVQCVGYFEDEQGNPLSESEYMEAVLNLPPMVMLHNGVYVPKDLPMKVAEASGFAELIPVKEGDISLSQDEIKILNQYIKDVYDLRNCSLLTPNSFICQAVGEGKYKCKKNITDEEFDSSLMVLRRICMRGDIASFTKVMSILQDSRKIHHPLVTILSEKNKRYNKLLRSPVDHLEIIKRLFGGMAKQFPTCEEILNVYWYVDRLHQGDKDKQALNAKVRTMIPDEGALDFALYCIFRELSIVFADVAKQAETVLRTIGEFQVKKPEKRISNIERGFRGYLKEMSYKIAEIIWRERECPPCGITVFQPEAMSEIRKRFSISDEIEI